MYEHQGLQDIFFIMLYGGATFLALTACVYLLFRSSNAFAADVRPPRELRCWTAAFMASVFASHIWWVLLGIVWLADDRLMRNIVAITLDRLTFVPLMMCVLLRMLQDRRRPLWPMGIAFVPIALMAVFSMVTRYTAFEQATEYYSMFIGITFVIYFVYAVRQYTLWLHENYADLERKELWQSLLLLSFILFIYIIYTSNEGGLLTEYLAQFNTLVIIFFILWRVETLQGLDAKETILPEDIPTVNEDNNFTDNAWSLAIPDNIKDLLDKHCVAKQRYLQHDLTLQQLATYIGSNRTYLSAYFAQQGITYNAYINRLRIDHFMRLYRKKVSSGCSITAAELAQQSGFRSYTTFFVAFKQFNGQTVTAWMKSL
jgi:AraC-like DNA-binding protein